MKFAKNFTGVLFLLFLGLALFMGVAIYNQAKTPTFPNIEALEIEDYFVNIGNAIMSGEEVEFPDEIITGMIKRAAGEDIACMISEENTLMIFLKRELPIIGEADVCTEFELKPFESTDESIEFVLKDCYVGTYNAPEFLYSKLMEDLQTISIPTDIYSIDFMGFSFAVSFENVNVKNGKLYIEFLADTGLKLG